MCTLLTQNICLMCHTQVLRLYGNNIGDAGLTALAKAVESGALDKLERLFLSHNAIGDVGMSAFADAVSKGALAQCTFLNLSWNQIGDAGLSALAGALSSGALSKLNILFIDSPSAEVEALCSSKSIKLNTF